MSTDRNPPERSLSWDAESLWRQIEPLLPGLSVEVLARTDSTNTQLVQRLRGGHGPVGETDALPGRRASDTQPCLIVAEHQTAGRGRMGRSWHAAPGASLTFSLAVPLAPHDWSGLSLVVGVALATALDPRPADAGDSAPLIGLKWPNDLWYDERKLGGILVETLAVGTQRLAIIGVGLNVLPMDVGPLSSGYACLSEFDPAATAVAALHRVVRPMVEAVRRFERSGFAPFAAEYQRRDVLNGRLVRGGAIEGTVLGVTPTGGLRVQTEQGEQVITSSEVSIRLNPWGPTTQSGIPC